MSKTVSKKIIIVYIFVAFYSQATRGFRGKSGVYFIKNKRFSTISVYIIRTFPRSSDKITRHRLSAFFSVEKYFFKTDDSSAKNLSFTRENMALLAKFGYIFCIKSAKIGF